MIVSGLAVALVAPVSALLAQLPTGRAPRLTPPGRSPLRALAALTPSGVLGEVAVTARSIQGPLRPARGAKHRDSGERVTQPARPGHPGDRPRPPRAFKSVDRLPPP